MAQPDMLADFISKASAQWSTIRPLLPMYTHIILAALFPLYTGAHASLSRPASAAKPKKKTKKAVDDDDDEEEDKVQKMEGLSNSDAIVLPITAGLVLASLYFLIKKYGADLINFIMGYYFAGVGVFSIAKLVNDAGNLLVSFVFPRYFRYKSSGSGKQCLVKVVLSERRVVQQDESGDLVHATGLPVLDKYFSLGFSRRTTDASWALRRGLKQKYTVKGYIHTIIDLCLNVDVISILSGLVGLGTVIYVNTVSKPWFLTNLQGFAVSYSALQLLSPTTFVTGSLILSSLFFYDIWAVFFTPLMVGVAKNLDQPIKLVFPRPDEPAGKPGEPPVKSFSMLGLGDIVVPGIMIGLALRFDLYMFYLKKQKKANKATTAKSSDEADGEEAAKKAPYVSVSGRWGDWFWTRGLPYDSLPAQLQTSFPKPYFTASMVGYVTGMATTLGVMSIFHHAQPALLYLVPGVLASLWGTAFFRRELKQIWDFSEALSAEQIEESEGKKGTETKKEIVEQSPKGLFERMWHEIWNGEEKKTEDQKSVDKKSESEAAHTAEDGKESSAEETESDGNDGVLFAFSISRMKPTAKSSTRATESTKAKDPHFAATSSPALSEGSEDAVVVSSADLDGAQQSDAGPRYRTRTTRSGKH